MKVAFFIGSLNRGGTETLILDVCRNHRVTPFEVLLIYRNEGELSEQYRQTGVQMVRLKPKHGRYLSYLMAMRQMLKCEKVDILHAQTLTNSVFSFFCTQRLPIKVITTFHGFPVGRFANPMTRFVMRHSDMLFYVSDYVREWYIKRYGLGADKSFTVYNGVGFDKLDAEYPTPDFLKKTDPPQAVLDCHAADPSPRIRLAMIGNFVSGRAQNSLLRCIHQLVLAGTRNFDFYFVGKRVDSEPERYDDCVRYVEDNGLTDNVHFVGSRGDVPAILQHIDGFVYSTDHDTFGIAVVEAMAAGVPVVVNDWAVMKEITNNGQWGTLYKTNDAKNGAKVIADLIQKNQQYKQQAKQTAIQVRQTFSIEQHIARLYELYQII